MTEFPDTHSVLLAQIQSLGDREAWEQFVALYRPVIYRMARRRGFQEADAQDLAQRVLISVANAIPTWSRSSESTRFRHWLRRVVKNAIINMATRKPKDLPVGGSIDNDSNGWLSPIEQVCDEDTERELGLEYRREIFNRAAALVQRDVNTDSWQAFRLTVIEGQSAEETAQELQKSVGAVYAARGRIMHRIKDSVKQIEENWE